MLTDLKIRNLKPSGRQQEIADRGEVAGLTLRMNQTGTKTFFLAYRTPSTGKQARVRIGEYGPRHFGLARAREVARAYRALLDRGVDPRDHLKAEAGRRQREQEETRRADVAREASTFSVVVEDYVTKFQVAKKQTAPGRKPSGCCL